MTGDGMAFIVPVSNDCSGASRKLKPGDTLIVKDVFGLNGDDLSPSEARDPVEVSIFYADMAGQSKPKVEYRIGVAVAGVVQQILVQMEEAEALSRRSAALKGISKAREQGVKIGRKPLERPENFEEVYHQWKLGEISSSAAARLLNVSRTTFMRWAGVHDDV